MAAVELISALLDVAAEETSAPEVFAVEAVRQTEDPRACLRQTWRFVVAATRRHQGIPMHANPGIAWMRARCAACGTCRIGG